MPSVTKFPFRDDFFDILEVFGDPDALQKSPQMIDEAYLHLKRIGATDAKRHFAWKVLRDTYYRELIPTLSSFAELYDAGFFVDTIEPEEASLLYFQAHEARTPISQVARMMKRVGLLTKPVVLLSTGAFSPLHNGHVGMMCEARAVLEKQGYQVIGGFLSPSHDAYVSQKYSGDAALSAAHRVHLAQLVLSESDWLRVDPWESRYLPTDVNFTDVIARLKTYLNTYLHSEVPIEVAYVYGGDNVGFSAAFAKQGIGVCVGRNGSSPTALYAIQRQYPGAQLFWGTTDEGVGSISSSRIRKWTSGFLPSHAEKLYFTWKKNMLQVYETARRPKRLYVLRNDSDWALRQWEGRVDPVLLNAAKEVFLEKLQVLIEQAFLRVQAPDLPTDIEVRIYDHAEQELFVRELEEREALLNLDRCTNTVTDIQFSRLFSLCDGQFRPLQLIERPGFASISEQIRAIKPGKYTLVDDDIASGSTINMLLGLLPEDVQVTKIRTLLEYSRSRHLREHPASVDLEMFDVVDFRDFLFGSRDGGLVVSLPDGSVARAPYSLPYLSLVTRASIPPSTEQPFSQRIWGLNLAFFQMLDAKVTIADTDPGFRRFANYIGFADSVTMEDFCHYHIDELRQYI